MVASGCLDWAVAGPAASPPRLARTHAAGAGCRPGRAAIELLAGLMCDAKCPSAPGWVLEAVLPLSQGVGARGWGEQEGRALQRGSS